MSEIRMLTDEERELCRQDRLNEVGSEEPCPLCGRPRVTRSCYVRCNPCGLNWEDGTDLSVHPRTRTAKPDPTRAIDGNVSTTINTSE